MAPARRRASTPRSNATSRQRRIVLTGGPGAGKTAALELARLYFSQGVYMVPESAALLFRGGFPRVPTRMGRRAVQRAIFTVQHEMEGLAEDSGMPVALCDRGLLDGLAYWPNGENGLLEEFGTTRADLLQRYWAVIHMRTPRRHLGYNRSNPVRTESAHEAAEVDGRIEHAWRDHPRRFFVEATPDFLSKAMRVLSLIRDELPRGHPARRAGLPHLARVKSR